MIFKKLLVLTQKWLNKSVMNVRGKSILEEFMFFRNAMVSLFSVHSFLFCIDFAISFMDFLDNNSTVSNSNLAKLVELVCFLER